MSSLGFQTIYREINAHPRRVAERAFLPDDVAAQRASGAPLCTYESGRPVSSCARGRALGRVRAGACRGDRRARAVAASPRSRAERDASAPFVLCGGPLTNSNPLPLAPFADAILMGEAEESVHQALDVLAAAATKDEALRRARARDPELLRAEHPRRGAAAAGQGRAREAAGVGADPHAAHRALEHVPARGRARLLARLRVLRDAAQHQRRHAHRRAGAHPRADSGRCAQGRAWSARRSAITRRSSS